MPDEFEEVELEAEDYQAALEFLASIGIIEMYGMDEDGNVSYQLCEAMLAAFAVSLISREQWLDVGRVRGFDK